MRVLLFAVALAAPLTAPAAQQATAETTGPAAPSADGTYAFNDCGQAGTREQESRLRNLLYDGSGRLDEERVQVEGTVRQYVQGDSKTTDYYLLEDSYGVAIMVQTPSVDKPAIGDQGCVDATINLKVYRPGDEATTYLSTLPEAIRLYYEGGRGRRDDGSLVHPILRQSAFVAAALPPAPPPPPPPSNQNAWWPWALGGAALLTLLGLGYVYTRRNGDDAERTRTMLSGTPPTGTTPPRTPTGPVPTPGPSPTAGPSAIDDLLGSAEPVSDVGGTIKIYRPKDMGTVKVLPGRLRVEGGLTGIPEIRFFMPRGRTTTEITFGRASGPPYEHVELTPRTVSSKQARLIYDGGAYTLVNHAARESNPTQINGREMDRDERVVLADGDRISMGEVDFTYLAQ